MIQIDASIFAEFEISEFEILRFDCTYLHSPFFGNLQEEHMSQVAPVIVELPQRAQNLAILRDKALLDQVPPHHPGLEVGLEVRVMEGLVLVTDVHAIWVTKVKVIFLLTLVFLQDISRFTGFLK